MTAAARARELIELYQQGIYTKAELFGALVALLEAHTIDPVLAALPDVLRGPFEAELEDIARDDTPADELVVIGGELGREEAAARIERYVAVTRPAVRAWLARRGGGRAEPT